MSIQVAEIRFLVRFSVCRSTAMKKKLIVRQLVVVNIVMILFQYFGGVSDSTNWVKASKYSGLARMCVPTGTGAKKEMEWKSGPPTIHCCHKPDLRGGRYYDI